MEDKINKVLNILLTVFILLTVVGIFIKGESQEERRYPTYDYWVAADYHHVYDKSNGRIEDYISDNETIKIEGDEIIVTERLNDFYYVGEVMTWLFGFCAVTILFVMITNSEWWERVTGG